MAESGFHFDFGNFFGNLKERNSSILKAAEKGVGKAMLQMLNDTVTQVPTVPLREGTLRGATSIFVQNKRIKDPILGDATLEKRNITIPVGGNEIVGRIFFNVPYAARMHEVRMKNYTEPSSGPKFLESKLANNKNTYKKIVGITIMNE